MVWWLTSQEPVAAVTGGKIATAAHAAAQRLGSTRECGTQNELGLTSPPAGSRRAKGESHTRLHGRKVDLFQSLHVVHHLNLKQMITVKPTQRWTRRYPAVCARTRWRLGRTVHCPRGPLATRVMNKGCSCDKTGSSVWRCSCILLETQLLLHC